MRLLAAVAVVLVGLSASGVAQTNSNSKGTNSSKSSTRPPKSTVPMKAGNGGNTSGNAKNLQSIEHETAKTAGKSEKSQRAPKPVALKPEKGSNSNAPINFGGKSGGGIGTTKTGNPYKGRLKQKGNGHAH
jgi:hypothetical protein